MENLEEITQNKYESFGLKDIKEVLKYTIPASIVITGLYVGSYLSADSEREREFKRIVDEAKVIELSEPAIGYMQLFRAEKMGSDPRLLEHYRQKIIQLNPNYDHDLVVRKAPDINKDGAAGEN